MDDFPTRGILIKDPTVWLGGARPPPTGFIGPALT
jgi:hypothetical protein